MGLKIKNIKYNIPSALQKFTFRKTLIKTMALPSEKHVCTCILAIFNIGKNDGITQALWKHVKEQNMEISDGFISKLEWDNAINEIDLIYEAHKKRGETIFSGGTERDDWHKNYVVHKGQEITFSADEMNKIYKALGVSLQSTESVELEEAEEEKDKNTDTITENTADSDTLVGQQVVTPANSSDTNETETVQPVEKKKNKKGLWAWLGIGAVALLTVSVLFATKGKGKNIFKKVFNKSPKIESNIDSSKVKTAIDNVVNDSKGSIAKNVEPEVDLVALRRLRARNARQRRKLNNIDNNHHGATTKEIYAAVDKSETIKNATKSGTKTFSVSGDTYVVTINEKGGISKVLRKIGANGDLTEITDPTKLAKFEAKHFDKIYNTSVA